MKMIRIDDTLYTKLSAYAEADRRSATSALGIILENFFITNKNPMHSAVSQSPLQPLAAYAPRPVTTTLPSEPVYVPLEPMA